MTKTWLALVAIGSAVLVPQTGWAQMSNDTVKIGVLTDMNGPYADNTGVGTVLATQMAIDDFGGKINGKAIEIVSADHQNKPDVGASIARKWADTEGVDVIVDVVGSAVAFAVQNVAAEKNRVMLNVGSGAADLTGPACTPVSVQWAWDTYSFGGILGKALVKRGLDTFFFIAVDYAFGAQLERDMTVALEQAGGKRIGGVRHPFGTTDFSSYLLQAQSSKAKVIAIANAGNDQANTVKQGAEFGIRKSGQEFAAIVAAREVKAIGLPVAQGLLAPTSWYWDLDDETRAFSKRFQEKRGGMPSEFQAGAYSAVLHYLKAVQAAGTDEAKAVVRKMKELPIADMYARHAKLREDGRMVHDMYLVQAKAPAESKSDWDVLKVLATVPGDEAFRPMAEGKCPLVKKP